MSATVTEIAKDVFRISSFNPAYGMQFNQFLVRGEASFLMHAGFRAAFPDTLAAVRTLIDPATLAWVGFSHFESDECGALNQWLAVAPRAQAACSMLGAMVNVGDFAERPPRGLADGEVVDAGSHKLRFLSTPHVPHCWDAGLFYEETTGTLLCSDLMFQPGNPAPLVETDVLGPAREAILGNLEGPMSKDLPYTSYTDATLRRLADLAPGTLGIMHGSSYRGDGRAALNGLADVLAGALGGRG